MRLQARNSVEVVPTLGIESSTSLKYCPTADEVLARQTLRKGGNMLTVYDVADVRGTRVVGRAREARSVRNFIKEPCWDSTGAAIMSPHINTVRLFSRTDVPAAPRLGPVPQLPALCAPLPVVHTDAVLTACGSPIRPEFLAGGLDGAVSFIQPCF